MKVASLFAGIGGFDLALTKLGHEIVYVNEWDKYSAQTYEKNFLAGTNVSEVGGGEETQESEHESGKGLHTLPNETTVYQNGSNNEHTNWSINQRQFTRVDTRDITTVPTSDIPDHELLVGGFPCQAFSVAGKRGGFNDTRGTLFFEVARILRDKRPRYFILENVKGLLSHDSGKTFQTILGVLSDLGYDVEWQVLNSKNFGVPQNRERVYFVGYLGGKPTRKIFPIEGANSTALEYVGGIVSEANKKWLEDGKNFSRNFPQGQRVYKTSGIASTIAANAGGLGGKTGLYQTQSFIDLSYKQSKLTDQARTLQARYYKGVGGFGAQNSGVAIPVLTPDRVDKRQEGRRFKDDGEPAFTLTGQDKHGIYDGMRIRKLTPLECERLQGFPDNWTAGVSDTQRYKQLGNAVTVNVVYEVAKRLFS